MEKEAYRRLNLKNGWDLPKGEKPPLTGRKQELIRAYELLVQKSDEDYMRDAEAKKEKMHRREAGGPVRGAGTQSTETKKIFEGTSADGIKTAGEMPAELYELTEADWRKRHKIRLLTGTVIVLAAVIVIGGRVLFGPPVLTANISAYEDVPITIEGITEEPFDITPKELSKMRKDSIRVEVHEEELGPDDVAELGRAIGPTVETFLKAYGVSLEDVRSMKVYAENDRSTAYVHTLEDSKIILSVANGRKPLGEKEAPLRIAVADSDAGEWSGWIRRIVFTMK